MQLSCCGHGIGQSRQQELVPEVPDDYESSPNLPADGSRQVVLPQAPPAAATGEWSLSPRSAKSSSAFASVPESGPTPSSSSACLSALASETESRREVPAAPDADTAVQGVQAMGDDLPDGGPTATGAGRVTSIPSLSAQATCCSEPELEKTAATVDELPPDNVQERGIVPGVVVPKTRPVEIEAAPAPGEAANKEPEQTKADSQASLPAGVAPAASIVRSAPNPSAVVPDASLKGEDRDQWGPSKDVGELGADDTDAADATTASPSVTQTQQFSSSIEQLGDHRRKIFIFTFGTTGEILPFANLARCLKDRGHQVKISTNDNYAQKMEDHGLKVLPAYFSFDDLKKYNPAAQEALESGQFHRFAKIFDEMSVKCLESVIRKQWEEIQSFRPDLLICGTEMDAYQANVFSEILDIPLMHAFFQMNAVVRDKSSCCQYSARLFDLLLYGWEETWLKPDYIRKVLKSDSKRDALVDTIPAYALEFMTPIAPCLLFSHQEVISRPPDLPQQYENMLQYTGYTGLPLALQGSGASASEDPEGKSEDKWLKSELESFIADSTSDKKRHLVFMGWGAFAGTPPKGKKSGQHMGEFAIRTLEKAKCRGIVFMGPRELTDDSIKNDPLLSEYSRQNVKFLDIQKGEHINFQWIFERCDVVVHHGGFVSTWAALRAGKPSVITPFGFTQFDNAAMVEHSAAGIKMPHFSKVSPLSLSRAIEKCLEPATKEKDSIREKARRIGERLREESASSGMEKAMNEIERFLENDVSDWRQRLACRRMMRDKRLSKNMGCFGGFGRCYCMAFACNVWCCGVKAWNSFFAEQEQFREKAKDYVEAMAEERARQRKEREELAEAVRHLNTGESSSRGKVRIKTSSSPYSPRSPRSPH